MTSSVPVEPGDDKHRERGEQEGGDHQVEHQPIVQDRLDQALAGALEQRGILPVAHCITCGNLHPVIHHACCANAWASRADLEQEVEQQADRADRAEADNVKLRWALSKGLTEAEAVAFLEDG